MTEVKEMELSGVLVGARDLQVYNWANKTGYHISDMVKAREVFHKLPYEERRLYYVRPGKGLLEPTEFDTPQEEVATIKAAYKASGDASHAMRAVGVELGVPWVEQKRNSQGMVEILASDLYHNDPTGELTAMEVMECRARDDGLYEAVGGEVPALPEEELDTEASSDRLLEIARERIPSNMFAMFLLVKVDGQPIRKVAREFSVSYRAVWQAVDFVRDSLRRIAAEEVPAL